MQTPGQRHRDVSAAVSKWVIPDLAKLTADYESPTTTIETNEFKGRQILGNWPMFKKGPFIIQRSVVSISNKRVAIHTKTEQPENKITHPDRLDVARSFTKEKVTHGWYYGSPAINVLVMRLKDSTFTPVVRVFNCADREDPSHVATQLDANQLLKELFIAHLEELSTSESSESSDSQSV